MPDEERVTRHGCCDYSNVSEVTGGLVSREAWQMMCARYRFAASLSAGRRILEVACGSGQGVRYLEGRAQCVVGGDLDRGMLRRTTDNADRHPRLTALDAEAIPFPDGSFDVVLLYEAIYYLPEPDRFFNEAHRVLSDEGILILCSANPDRPDFIPSPHSHRYFSAVELRRVMQAHGFAPEVFGAFPIRGDSVRDAIVSLMRRLAVALRLIPKTMRGKVWLKRFVYGRLVAIKPVIDDGPAPALVAVDADSAPRYKVLYAIGRRVSAA